MTRRSYGTGSLSVQRDRNGREVWYGRWRVGNRRVNRRIGLKRSAGSVDGLTKAQAERELRKRMAQETLVEVRGGISLVDAANRYVDHVELRGAKRTTVMDYRSYIRVHFETFFGDKRLIVVKPADVERFVRVKRSE